MVAGVTVAVIALHTGRTPLLFPKQTEGEGGGRANGA